MTTKTFELDTSEDMIDVRDIIERVEELRSNARNIEENKELAELEHVLLDLAGMGGDEKFDGEWYPCQLIRDSYFEDHARELATDCGMIKDDAQWPYTCIDWDQAARELRQDYTSTEIDGVTFWYR